MKVNDFMLCTFVGDTETPPDTFVAEITDVDILASTFKCHLPDTGQKFNFNYLFSSSGPWYGTDESGLGYEIDNHDVYTPGAIDPYPQGSAVVTFSDNKRFLCYVDNVEPLIKVIFYNHPFAEMEINNGAIAKSNWDIYPIGGRIKSIQGCELIQDLPQSDTKNWCDVKNNICRIALDEELLWRDGSGKKRIENEPVMLPTLQRYWATVPNVNSLELAMASANHSEAWSAAFICSVFNDSGVKSSDGFIFSRRHLVYIVGALRNRENNDLAKPFWLCDRNEMLTEAIPNRGDLICYNRGGTSHSYESLRNTYWNNSIVPTGISHCDIVVSIKEQNEELLIATIGGNLNGSVRFKYLKIGNNQIMIVNKNGEDPKIENNIFGIIRLIECHDS